METHPFDQTRSTRTQKLSRGTLSSSGWNFQNKLWNMVSEINEMEIVCQKMSRVAFAN